MLTTIKRFINRTFRRNEVEMMVKNMSFDNGTMTATVSHPGVSIIAAELAQYFIGMKAVNFTEFSVVDYETMTPLLVTISRRYRPSPGAICKIYRDALKRIAEDPTDAKGIAKLALQRVGFDDATPEEIERDE